jgi:hypothetical protein
VVRVQLATGLLGTFGMRPGGPQSSWPGPWWSVGHWATAGFDALVVAALVTWLVVRQVRRRRRSVAFRTVDA